MNLKESIRRILREEYVITNFIRRRVPMDIIEEEFDSAILYVSDLYLKRYKNKLSLEEGFKEYTRLVITVLIDGIHWLLFSQTSDDIEWYDDVFNNLKDYYKDRIKEGWKSLY